MDILLFSVLLLPKIFGQEIVCTFVRPNGNMTIVPSNRIFSITQNIKKERYRVLTELPLAIKGSSGPNVIWAKSVNCSRLKTIYLEDYPLKEKK